MLKKANMKIVDLFGDYSLNEFNAIDSDRLIIISRKLNN